MTSAETSTPSADESGNRQARPTFVLAPGLPAVDELATMFRALTGREPDPEDLEEARQILASIDDDAPKGTSA